MPGQRCADGRKVKRFVLGEIGNAKSAAHVEMRHRYKGIVRQSCSQRDNLRLRFNYGLRIKRLAASVDVKSAKMRAIFDDISHHCRNALFIHAKRLGSAAHLHARAAHLECGIDPDRQSWRDTAPVSDRQSPLRFAFGFDIERDTSSNRSFQLRIAFARPCKTDLARQKTRCARRFQFSARGNVEAIDLIGNPRKQWCIRICFHGIMQRHTSRHCGAHSCDARCDNVA